MTTLYLKFNILQLPAGKDAGAIEKSPLYQINEYEYNAEAFLSYKSIGNMIKNKNFYASGDTFKWHLN